MGSNIFFEGSALRSVWYNNSILIQHKKLQIQKTSGTEDKLYQIDIILPVLHFRIALLYSIAVFHYMFARLYYTNVLHYIVALLYSTSVLHYSIAALY